MKMPFRAALVLLAASVCAPALAQYAPFTSAPAPLPAVGGGEVFTVTKNGVPYTASLSQLAGLGGGLTAGTITSLPAPSTALTGTEGSACVQSGQLVQCNPALQSAYTLGAGITGLGAAGTLTGSETNNLVQGGVAVKTPLSAIAGYSLSTAAAALPAAGPITGTESITGLQGGAAVRFSPAQQAGFTLTTGVTGASAAGSLAGTEVVPGVTSAGGQVKITAAQIAALAGVNSPARFPSYLGPVTNRAGQIPVSTVSGYHYFNLRQFFYARDKISALWIAVPNYYVGGNGSGNETGTGDVAATTMSIEYPAGTIASTCQATTGPGVVPTGTPSTTNSIANNTLGWMYCPGLAIPNRAKAYVRSFINWVGNTTPYELNSGAYGAGGDGFESSQTVVADKTQNASATYTAASGSMFFVSAILGQTTKRSFLLLGDSRVCGVNDTGDNTGDRGNLERAVGPVYGLLSLCASGSSSTQWYSNTALANSKALYAFGSDMIYELGVNDVKAGGAATNALQGLGYIVIQRQTAVNDPNTPIYAATLEPSSISTTAITAATSSGTTGTVTIDATKASFLTVGETITVAGVTPTGYNGNVVITAISGGNVSYTLPSGGSGLGNGTAFGTVSDNFQSAGFQSVANASGTAQILSYNASLRGGVAGIAGIIDTSDAVSARGSGVWLAEDGFPQTGDGLHANARGYRRMQSVGSVIRVIGQ